MSANPRPTVEPITVNDSPFPVSSDDPTATKTIRNRYGAEMYRRFRALKSAIIEGVVENDAFGLGGLSPDERAGPRTPARFEAAEEHRRGGADAGINIRPPEPGAFAYPSDQQKVEEFTDWLNEQIDRGILESAPSGARGVAADQAWQNTYLRQSYAAGVNHADAYLVAQGVITSAQTLDDIWRVVSHADGAGLIYTRAYNELDGVTDAMAQEMSRVLAEGLTRGHNPNRIATALNDRVENVGLSRGRLISRTEVIRAHNEAALNRYEEMDDRLGGVTTVVEHMTANDNLVCDECLALAGNVYTKREARGRIPVHPNCRCTWAPVPADQVPPGTIRGTPAEERVDAVLASVADLPEDEQVARLSEFLSENTRYGELTDVDTINLSGLDPERSRAIANVMLKMEDRGYLTPIGTFERHPDYPAVMRVRNLGRSNAPVASATGPQVTFNSALYTREELGGLIEDGWLTGRDFAGRLDPLEAAVVHEFGHVFHLSNVYDNPRLFGQFMNGRFYSQDRRRPIRNRISRYAATQPAEFVAETFVRLAYGMPVDDDMLRLYGTFGGPDPDRYRGFMRDDDLTGNMADEPRTNDVADVEYPDDLPESLRAEAEAVMAAFRDFYEEVDDDL